MKKILVLSFIFSYLFLNGFAKFEQRKSPYVIKTTNNFDDTPSFKKGLSAKYLIIKSGRYFVKPGYFSENPQACLVVSNNQTIICENGVTICAISGSMTNTANAVLWDITRKNNVTIKSSGRAIFTMDRTNFPAGSQFHHGFQIQNSNNIYLENLSAICSGGDGFYTGSDSVDTNPTTNLTLKNCIADGNFRNGITVNHNVNTTVQNSIFRNQKGSSICAGICVESDWVYSKFINVNFINCDIYGNTTCGVNINLLAANGSDSTSNTPSVNFINNTISAYASFNTPGIQCMGPIQNGPLGNINFVDTIVNSTTGAGFSIGSKCSTLTAYAFTRCVFKNYALSKASSLNRIFADSSYPLTGFWYGGVTFNQCDFTELTRGPTNYQVDGFKQAGTLGVSDIHGSNNTFTGYPGWGWYFSNRCLVDVTGDPFIVFYP